MAPLKNRHEYSEEHFRAPSLIPVDSCFIDERYQRPPSRQRYTKIANEWDTSLATPITVSKRVAPDGKVTYAVVDGGHRYMAASLRMLENIAAYVKTGLSVQQEAKLFHDLNHSRKATTPRDNFKASYVAGDPNTVKIVDIVTNTGFYVDNVPVYKGGVKPKGGFRVPVMAAVEMFNMDNGAGVVLKKALLCLESAWGKKILDLPGSEPMNGALIVGLAQVLAKANTDQLLRLENQLRDSSPWDVESVIITAGAKDQKMFWEGKKKPGTPPRPSETQGMIAKTSFRLALIDVSNRRLRTSSSAYMKYENFLPSK